MMTPLIVFGVLAIILIAGLIKSASTWNWIPIVLVLFIFGTAIFAGIYSSKTLLTRSNWMEKDQQNQQLAEQAQIALDESLYGPANAISYSPESLAGTNDTLNLITLGSGRIWRGGQATVQADQQVTVTFAAPVDDADPRPSPASQLKQDMQVFAFADRSATIDNVLVPLPIQYVGTFLVQSAANDSVTIKPLFVTEYSAGEAAEPTTTWTLFETMPGDGPGVFRDDLNLGEFDITAYRTALRDKYLPADSLGLAPDSKEYEALLDEYTFDGLAMNEIQQWIDAQADRINDRFDPDDSNKESEIQFAETSPPMTVDGTGNVVKDGVFDPEGLANDPNLKLGSDVTIKAGEKLRAPKRFYEEGFPQADGSNRTPLKQEWEGSEAIVDYYARPLRDYPFALRELGEKADRMRESLAAMKADIEVSQAMIDNTRSQIDNRGDLIVKLQSDISRREQELAEISDHRQNLEQEVSNTRQQIRTYYEQIIELHRSLMQPRPMQDTRTAPRDDSILTSQR